jgi:hypothetical protein
MTDESYLDLGFGLTLWVSEMIQDESSSFRAGFLAQLSEPRAHEGQAALNEATGRGSIKQRPNPLNSAARTAELGHIVLFSFYVGMHRDSKMPSKFSLDFRMPNWSTGRY